MLNRIVKRLILWASFYIQIHQNTAKSPTNSEYAGFQFTLCHNNSAPFISEGYRGVSESTEWYEGTDASTERTYAWAKGKS